MRQIESDGQAELLLARRPIAHEIKNSL